MIQGSIDIPKRAVVMAEHKQKGGGVAAVLPIHYPRALFRACGLLPVEVWGPPGVDTAPGDEHLQSYTCSIVRSALAFERAGGLEAADLIMVPHACDSLQGLGSLLLDLVKPTKPVLTLYLPRDGTASAREFFAAELRVKLAELSDLTGKMPSDQELLTAIHRDEVADDCLRSLMAQGLGLPDRHRYELARSREYLPAERFTELVHVALDGAPSEPLPGIPILLSGVLPEPMTVLDAIGDAGGRVVADDLICLGRRLYPAGQSDDPFLRMAERILNAPPDSTRGSSIAARIAHLEHLVTTSGARGVIFYEVKFCEPEMFYQPQIRAALGEHGIRSLSIEVDISEPHAGRIDTRLQAFLEVLS